MITPLLAPSSSPGTDAEGDEMEETPSDPDLYGIPGRITMRMVLLREANELLAHTPPGNAVLDVHALAHWTGHMGMKAPNKILYLMNTLIYSLQQGLSMETPPIDIGKLYRRVNQIATGCIRHCQVTKLKRITYQGSSEVWIASFDRAFHNPCIEEDEDEDDDEDTPFCPLLPPEDTIYTEEAIVKYLPSSEIYVAMMETFIQFYLRHVLKVSYVGNVYQLFFPEGSQGDGGKICIATEKIGTCDFKDLLTNNVSQTYRILHNIAVHLARLQERCGFIHGDLKPDNVRITLSDGHPTEIHFIDFGHSKITLRESGASYFEPYTLSMSKDFLPSGNYEYNVRNVIFDEDAFSSDLLYLMLMIFYYQVEYGQPVLKSILGNSIIRDFFIFSCKDGTIVHVIHDIAMCPHEFREYVLSKDFEVLFHWIPITDPDDQYRFLQQFRPIPFTRKIREILGILD